MVRTTSESAGLATLNPAPYGFFVALGEGVGFAVLPQADKEKVAITATAAILIAFLFMLTLSRLSD